MFFILFLAVVSATQAVPPAAASHRACEMLLSVSEIAMRSEYGSEHVVRLDAVQRESHRVSIRRGRFVWALDGRPLDTTGAMTIDERGDVAKFGVAIFAVSRDGRVYVSNDQEVGRFHHSSLVGGEPVLVAGEITTDASGRLLWISHRSGHYRPGPYRLRIFLDWLESRGVNLGAVGVGLTGFRKSLWRVSDPIDATSFRELAREPSAALEDVLLGMIGRWNAGRAGPSVTAGRAMPGNGPDGAFDSAMIRNAVCYLLFHAPARGKALSVYPAKYSPTVFEAAARLARDPSTRAGFLRDFKWAVESQGGSRASPEVDMILDDAG